MSDAIITVVARTKSGHVQTFECTEIISIDGRPYIADVVDVGDLVAAIADLQSRMQIMESINHG